jgi:hypothetical protein
MNSLPISTPKPVAGCPDWTIEDDRAPKKLRKKLLTRHKLSAKFWPT